MEEKVATGLSQEEMLQDLTDRWLSAKSKEKIHNEERLAIEEAILKMVPVPAKGTFNLHTGLKFVVSEKMTIDQQMIAGVYNAMKDKSLFPFMFEAKPVTERIKDIKENHPEVWKMFVPALTIKPSKPSFSFKE